MIYTDERVFMNTIIRIQVVSSKGTIFTRSKIDHAYSFFKNVVANYSRFSSQSELSKLNHASGSKFKCSPELFTLISQALTVSKVTKGAFDPTVIDLLEAYGYDKKQNFEKLNNPDLFDEIRKMAKNRPSISQIEIDSENLTVKLQKHQRLDLGSIGKGYAIDLAHEYLQKWDFSGFLINAGGDIRAFGTNQENLPWKLVLFRSQLPNHIPDNVNSLGTVEILNKSICGSGGWARRVGIFHHLLNPATGFPINEISQTFVIADTACVADVWATALYVTGPNLIPELEKRDLAGLVVDYKGQVFKTKNFQYDN